MFGSTNLYSLIIILQKFNHFHVFVQLWAIPIFPRVGLICIAVWLNCGLSNTKTLVISIKNEKYWCQLGAELGGCQGGYYPPKFCLSPPVAPPKFFRSLSESPTQTIDSSPCCKTGPSSGPPKWRCLAPPLVSAQKSLIGSALILICTLWNKFNFM